MPSGGDRERGARRRKEVEEGGTGRVESCESEDVPKAAAAFLAAARPDRRPAMAPHRRRLQDGSGKRGDSECKGCGRHATTRSTTTMRFAEGLASCGCGACACADSVCPRLCHGRLQVYTAVQPVFPHCAGSCSAPRCLCFSPAAQPPSAKRRCAAFHWSPSTASLLFVAPSANILRFCEEAPSRRAMSTWHSHSYQCGARIFGAFSLDHLPSTACATAVAKLC